MLYMYYFFFCYFVCSLTKIFNYYFYYCVLKNIEIIYKQLNFNVYKHQRPKEILEIYLNLIFLIYADCSFLIIPTIHFFCSHYSPRVALRK